MCEMKQETQNVFYLIWPERGTEILQKNKSHHCVTSIFVYFWKTQKETTKPNEHKQKNEIKFAKYVIIHRLIRCLPNILFGKNASRQKKNQIKVK